MANLQNNQTEMNMKHLFVTGAGRSGTTLLMRILNRSALVHLATEIHYFSSLYHNGFLKNLRKLKRKTKFLTIDDVFECIQSNKNFGVYWRNTPSFKFSEIEKYFHA